MPAHDDEEYDEKYEAYKQKIYNSYIHGLCIRYANQLPLPTSDINQQAQNIKPLMAKLVSCIYNLTTHMSYYEIKEFYHNLITVDKKTFCTLMYDKYQQNIAKKMSSIGAINTLLYALLLKDFYTGDFAKISTGGNFSPVLLEITRRYLKDEDYEKLSNFIYFPLDEVPYISNTNILCFINNCQKAIVSSSFDKDIFIGMIQDTLQEIIDTIYNLFGEKEPSKENNNLPVEQVP